MKLKFCSCPLCKAGRKSKWNQNMIVHAKRSGRHRVKAALKKGRWEDLPTTIAIPYTD